MVPLAARGRIGFNRGGPASGRGADWRADARAGFRVYRTGDLGRMHPDGCLEHLGRRDFQAKVRGQYVDLAAVEAALLSMAGISRYLLMEEAFDLETGHAETVAVVERLIRSLEGERVPAAGGALVS